MRRSLPLFAQLLLVFVGLLAGMAAVLTAAAYSSSRITLEDDARRSVDHATRTRAQTVALLFQLRQQHADAFLASLQSLCAEPLDSGRLAWAGDCVRTMVDDFRTGERATGILLTYGSRRIARAGQPTAAVLPPPGALAKIVLRGNGLADYVMHASLGAATLVVQFDHEEVAELFRDRSDLGRNGEVFLVDFDGRFLAPAASGLTAVPTERADAFLEDCRSGAAEFVDVDFRGVRSIQSFRPISALGTACVVARIGYDEALAPAETLRQRLVARGAWFVVIGVVLSLAAAQWISSPVRRLAASARALQTGKFDRPIPLAGPSEVRALGRAFNAMANDLAELVAKEQGARRDAEAASRAKDEFLATVSHELRTPLTAILGWAQMIGSGRLPPERMRHGVEVIERSARVQKQLIEDLLDVSRIVSNRMRVVRAPVRLADIVETALDTVRPQAAEKQITIETSLSEPAPVLGDAQRLEQVVWNLAWNAVKFTQPAGKVTVTLTRKDRQVVLAVADTGVGISSAFLPHVFEWFRQADTTSRSHSGLGLGLGIVRRLVQLHGGSVRAESRGEGKGATFTVSLPVHEPAAAALPVERTAEPSHSAGARRLDSVRVLVVEDDEATRELVRATLEDAGATVDVAASAAAARRELFADAPDVLISDIRMPEEDGYALMRSLRGAGVATPAIALTAYARPDDAEEARAAGFQIHLPKPVDAGRLIDAIAELTRIDTVH